MSSIDRQGPNTSSGVGDDENRDELFRDIHPLAPPPPPLPTSVRRREAWETGSHRSPSLSTGSDVASSENFTSMSREFSALVIAGSAIGTGSMEIEHGTSSNGVTGSNNNLTRIGEEDVAAVTEEEEETNPLAIVPDSHPLREGSSSPRRGRGLGNDYNQLSGGGVGGDRVAMPATSVQRVKKEEVEAKISAWQNAKVAKINNRFKREDAIIVGWEGEQIHKASSWMKKVERKLEEKRARAMEKMQNDVAKARRKAEEKRASAEAKRGTKVARVLEVANLMRAVGRAPAKRSFF